MKEVFPFYILFIIVSIRVHPNGNYSIMFYNCENLFDIYDDPHVADNEFLPNSRRNWTKQKFNTKVNSIAKIILATGSTPPIIVGLAEVENDFVIKELIQKSGLAKFHYQIIHRNSPDPRGIDVAAIYRPDLVKLIKYSYIRIDKAETNIRTRDILYMLTIIKTDTIHLFFNHWPSRRGDIVKTEQNRIAVAKMLRNHIDSIFSKNKYARIIIMGDFNDEPSNASIIKYLKALPQINNPTTRNLCNLSYAWLKNASWIGTYKFKNQWNIFDQVIVSGTLTTQHRLVNKSYVSRAEIFAPSFLLIPDEKYGGKKPYKGFNGLRWQGGFSDHLPVLTWLSFN